jgi:L,D-peptidoglycan transpeptidase YkuD (ErfK/YbiS/YcfS/YnhG family)
VARSRARRVRRALRAIALLGVTSLALGIGSSASGPGTTVSVAENRLAAAVDPDPFRSAPLDLRLLHPAAPWGYGTVDTRAAQAAAEAAAAQAAVAARAAAARAAETTAQGTSTPTRAPSASASGRSTSAPSRTAGPAGSGLPLGVDPGSSSQVVTVVAASARATTAKLTAWQRGADGWTAVLGPVTARVGAAGVGRASESTTRTPAGTFTLTEAFGRAGNPGTALPYRMVDGDDWWVSDVHSPRYNQYAQCAPGKCDFNEAAGENLFAAGTVYAQAVVIDYNRGGTPGAGSAYFLHVANGAPTAGCVAIDAGSLVTLMRWLDRGARPLISIGVG